MLNHNRKVPTTLEKVQQRSTRYCVILWGCSFLTLLSACSGGGVPITPEYGTLAPETPGSITADEQRYIQDAQSHLNKLLPDITLGPGTVKMADPFYEGLASYILETGTPTPGWERIARPLLANLETEWTTAKALTAPPRLQAIHLHYQECLNQYRKLLDLHQQEITQDKLLTSTDQSLNLRTEAFTLKARFNTFLEGFTQRHK